MPFLLQGGHVAAKYALSAPNPAPACVMLSTWLEPVSDPVSPYRSLAAGSDTLPSQLHAGLKLLALRAGARCKQQNKVLVGAWLG